MERTQVLLRPVITEKATMLREGASQVAFVVHQKANKIEIQKAVESTFGVKVISVNVVNQRPTKRAKGRRVVHVPGVRKAYVTLAEGNKIDLFEGV